MPLAQAFLSYTRDDDDHFGGTITALRHALELAIHVVTGDKSVKIFQDIDGIEFGEQWQSRLDRAIVEAEFLIPIITPLFFSSAGCRDELEKFIASETRLGHNDRILPIYFVTAPALEKQNQLLQDTLAVQVSKRQRYDWRSHAYLPVTDPKFRQEVRNLADRIAIALRRTTRPADFWSRSESENVRAPRNRPATERANTRQRSKTTTKTVLWVDDRPDNNVSEREAMERYGVQFVTSKSTEEAMARLRSRQFDAVISDMGRPPDMQAGYTLLDLVRSAGNPLPYFIYAGSAAPEHVAEALKRGAQGSTNNSTTLITSVLEAI